MRKTVLIAALFAVAAMPAAACEWMQSVSTPVPAEEDVVMTPVPTTPGDVVTN